MREFATLVSQRIREARGLAGLTQKELAQKLGKVSPRIIGDMERGIRIPKITELKRIAEVTGRPLSWFIASSDLPLEPGLEFIKSNFAKLSPPEREVIGPIFVHLVDFIMQVRNEVTEPPVGKKESGWTVADSIALPIEPTSLEIHWKHAIVGGQRLGVEKGGICVVDITDAYNAKLLLSPLQAASQEDLLPVVDIAVWEDGKIFSIGSNSQLGQVSLFTMHLTPDRHQPIWLKHEATVHLPAYLQPVGLEVSGSYLFIVANDRQTGLGQLEVVLLKHTKEGAWEMEWITKDKGLSLPAKAYDIDLGGREAFVALGKEGLLRISIGNPASPKIRGGIIRVSPDGEACDCSIQGQLAFVACGPGGIVALDSIDTTWEDAKIYEFTMLSEIEPLDWIQDIEVYSTTLLAVGRHFYEFDISNPSGCPSPQHIVDLGIQGKDVERFGMDCAAVATGGARLLILEKS
jgi:transcriptional regulator with XRE-family HTH domain